MKNKPHSLLLNLAVILNKPTGITNYTLNILPYLEDLAPTLLAAQPLPPWNYYPIPADLTPEQGFKGHLKRLLWTQFQLPRIYHKLQARLLFSPLPEAPLGCGCRFVVMVHDLIPLRFTKRFAPLTPYFRHYIPQVLQQAAHIVCNSEATARDIVDYYQINPAKITPIPLAYSASHFQPLSLPPVPTPYFLYLGRPNPYKNTPGLINAFSQFQYKDSCQLWLAGPSDRRYTPQLQQQVNALNLTEQVKFLDYVSYNDLPKLLNQALALVFPSLWEGFGLPVLEAMGCGTPVITSNLASLPEVTGEAALLVNPYHTAEITAAMEDIFTNPALRQELSQRSLKRARQFSWEKTGKATANILKKYI
jgi:glycosyltransferase involved in cell wall biosynthesis